MTTDTILTIVGVTQIVNTLSIFFATIALLIHILGGRHK